MVLHPCPICSKPVYRRNTGKRQPKTCSHRCGGRLAFGKPPKETLVVVRYSTTGEKSAWLLRQDLRLGWDALARMAKRAGFYAPGYSTRLVARALGTLYSRLPEPDGCTRADAPHSEQVA